MHPTEPRCALNNSLACSEAIGGKRQNDELNKGGSVGTGFKVQYAILVQSKHGTSMVLS
jgi:hypothetical protein